MKMLINIMEMAMATETVVCAENEKILFEVMKTAV